MSSPLAWGRGSKRSSPSPLAWGRGSKLCRPSSAIRSPLAWGRGSKRRRDLDAGCRLAYVAASESPLAWGRGSKQSEAGRVGACEPLPAQQVAPRVGAWIETMAWPRSSARRGRPSRGGVDRNHRLPVAWAGLREPKVAPRVGAWIETSSGSLRARTAPSGRPSRGGVDRNALACSRSRYASSRPSRGGVDRNIPRVASAANRRAESPLAWGRGSKRLRAIEGDAS